MKTVKVFVKTSLQGPCIRDGRYAAVVEYISSKGAVTREISGEEKETTYNRSVLLAVIRALDLLKVACSVTVYTDCVFVKNTAERGSLEDWRRSEWKKAGGGEVKNQDLWQQFTELADRHEIVFRFSKHNDYSHRLTELLEAGQ